MLNDSLSKIQSNKEKHIILCGDCNCPHINWDTHSVPPSFPDREVQEALVDLAADHHLTQIHQTPTMGDNLLDLVFATNESLIKQSSNILGISDHDMVITDSLVKPCKTRKHLRKCYNFRKVNWHALNR